LNNTLVQRGGENTKKWGAEFWGGGRGGKKKGGANFVREGCRVARAKGARRRRSDKGEGEKKDRAVNLR